MKRLPVFFGVPRRRLIFIFAVVALIVASSAANAKICPQCGKNHLPDDPPIKFEPPEKIEPDPEPTPEPEPTKPEPKNDDSNEPTEVVEASISRSRFSAPSVAIADAVDEILDRLEVRYGKPKTWKSFPIYFRQYAGNGVAGYTQYGGDGVVEVVVYEKLENAVGGTLDHELTHAFFFYYLGGNFDLFLNEGAAQNSEYRRRESLRQTVYKRYSAGDFWDLASLYGRNQYDGGLRIYHEGFSVVDFLIGRGGSLWFAAFLEDLQKSKDVDKALSRFYGYDNLSALQSAWLNYVISGQDRNNIRAVQ